MCSAVVNNIATKSFLTRISFLKIWKIEKIGHKIPARRTDAEWYNPNETADEDHKMTGPEGDEYKDITDRSPLIQPQCEQD